MRTILVILKIVRLVSKILNSMPSGLVATPLQVPQAKVIWVLLMIMVLVSYDQNVNIYYCTSLGNASLQKSGASL